MLGICVGLQLLFEDGEEAGGAKGLGILRGRIGRLPPEVKLPHIGWSPVRVVGDRSPLFAPLDGQYVYFAHSYAAARRRAGGSPARHPRPTLLRGPGPG